MNHLSPLLNTSRILAASLLVFGLASAGEQASRAADHSQEYKAMSMKDDLAHRSPDIHWPTGFEPEKADLFAHNDLIMATRREPSRASITPGILSLGAPCATS